MNRLFQRLGPLWRVQRRRRPAVTAAVERGALAARLDAAREIASLRTRVAELERDHLLLAAHVARLTEQRAAAGGSRPDAEQAAATARARLAAMAFYEERIGRLEAATARHARRDRARSAAPRTPGERSGPAR